MCLCCVSAINDCTGHAVFLSDYPVEVSRQKCTINLSLPQFMWIWFLVDINYFVHVCFTSYCVLQILYIVPINHFNNENASITKRTCINLFYDNILFLKNKYKTYMKLEKGTKNKKYLIVTIIT